MRIVVLALIASLTGCSQCDAPPATPDAAAKASPKAPKADAPKPTKVPAAAGDVGQLFPPQPGLPASLEGFDFAADRAALTAKFPKAVTEAGAPAAGFAGVTTNIYFFSKSDIARFAAVQLTEPLATQLKTLWGEGTPVKSPSGVDHYWISPDQKSQYVLAGETFAVWPVQDWHELLGDDNHFGFEKPERLLLGATEKQVMETYAHLRPRTLSGGRLELRFPPQPLRTSPTRVMLTLKDGVVDKIRLKLYYAKRLSPQKGMHTQLTVMYGAPIKDGKTHQNYEITQGDTKATVKVSDLDVTGFISVEVQRAEAEKPPQ